MLQSLLERYAQTRAIARCVRLLEISEIRTKKRPLMVTLAIRGAPRQRCCLRSRPGKVVSGSKMASNSEKQPHFSIKSPRAYFFMKGVASFLSHTQLHVSRSLRPSQTNKCPFRSGFHSMIVPPTARRGQSPHQARAHIEVFNI